MAANQYNLLIVDDEVSNLHKLRRTFFGDFRIFEALTGQDAIQLLRKQDVDVIITDQRMPETTGIDVLRESLLLQPEAVRIILTGYTEIDYLMDAINEGQVHRYITKPWEPFSLKRTVMQDLELVHLKREHRLLQEQLRIARQVQSRLFPQKLPEIPTLDYSGICQPAGEVGGDYYDVLKVSSDQFCLAVGDISGKGISAALLMASLQALLRSHASQTTENLAAVVTEVNRLLCSMTEENRFATLFCAVYDDSKRELTYVNAGHNPPLLFRPGASAADIQPVPASSSPGASSNGILRLEGGGAVLGMFPEGFYQHHRLLLGPGDTLIIYTDGITEAQDDEGREYGEERLTDLIRSRISHSPVELQNQILASVKEFAGEVSIKDDLTLLLVRVLD